MIRPLPGPARRGQTLLGRCGGYTIFELLMATTLTLILMLVVGNLFMIMGRGVSTSRALIEMTDRMRTARSRLQLDLEGLTVVVDPPRRPESGEGYLEYVEGPVGTWNRTDWSDWSTGTFIQPYDFAVNQDTGGGDSSAGDCDDVLMFTTRSRKGPFVGRYRSGTRGSYEAEVAWFVRGRTLYRRMLLVVPQVWMDQPAGERMDDNLDANNDLTDGNGVVDLVDTWGESFYNLYDISAHLEYDLSGAIAGWVPNTLDDLTKRENRYAHCVRPTNTPAAAFPDEFPYAIKRYWLTSPTGIAFRDRRWGQLGLPTLRECSHPAWMTWGNPAAAPTVRPEATVDLWNAPHPWVDASGAPQVDPVTGTMVGLAGPRVAEDVILTNVIGFDVKIWDPDAPVFGRAGEAIVPGDPGYQVLLAAWIGGGTGPIATGAYVDLNYANGRYSTAFSGPGQLAAWLPMVYDTWSFHYEHDGVDQLGGGTDLGTDGFDSDGDGVVDDIGEMEAFPPYPFPARGLQIKIRVFEPDTRQIREVTVIADLTPK